MSILDANIEHGTLVKSKISEIIVRFDHYQLYSDNEYFCGLIVELGDKKTNAFAGMYGHSWHSESFEVIA